MQVSRVDIAGKIYIINISCSTVIEELMDPEINPLLGLGVIYGPKLHFHEGIY
jgi:hypothetical protein